MLAIMSGMPEPTQPNYSKQISSDFPNLVVEKVEKLGTGWDHVALEVNDSLIFRFPRDISDVDEISQTVVYETKVLRHLQDKLPVAIPDPQHIAPDHAYFGYPKLQGEKLIDILPSFSEADKAALWDDWVDIATAIHQNVSVDMARKLGVPNLDIHIETAKEVFSLENIDSQVVSFAQNTIEAAEAIDMNKLPLLFIHNDLQFHNLLVDPETKRVIAVIDWTDVCIGTTERELAMWEWCHDDQLDEVAKRYTAKTGRAVDRDQAKVFRKIEEVGDYVEQIKSGDLEGVEESLAHIRKWIAEVA